MPESAANTHKWIDSTFLKTHKREVKSNRETILAEKHYKFHGLDWPPSFGDSGAENLQVSDSISVHVENCCERKLQLFRFLGQVEGLYENKDVTGAGTELKKIIPIDYSWSWLPYPRAFHMRSLSARNVLIYIDIDTATMGGIIRPVLPEELFAMQSMPLSDLFNGTIESILEMLRSHKVNLHDCTRICGMSFNATSALIALLALLAAIEGEGVRQL